jgi:hypothetical protein
VFVPDEPKLELVTGCNTGGWFKILSPFASAVGRPLISFGFASPSRNPMVFAGSPALKFAGVPGNPVPVYMTAIVGMGRSHSGRAPSLYSNPTSQSDRRILFRFRCPGLYIQPGFHCLVTTQHCSRTRRIPHLSSSDWCSTWQRSDLEVRKETQLL